MRELLVNELPARTWNRLGVNDSRVTPGAPGAADTAVQAGPGIAVSTAPYPAVLPSAMSGALPAGDGAAFVSLETETADTAPAVVRAGLPKGRDGALCLRLTAKENAKLRTVLVLTGGKDDEGTLTVRVEAQAEAGAVIELYTANLLGEKVALLDDVAARAGEKAVFSLQRLDLGGKTVHTAALAELAGRKSRFESGVVYRVAPDGLMDMNWLARHTGRKTESHIEVNGVLADRARKCFRGTIDFVRGCAGAKGAETESVLLMGDNQVNQTVPLILCQEEDVDGSHGASIGRLDDKMLFYLASRGISEQKAREMLARSRADLMRDRFPDEAVREEIDRFLSQGESN